MINLDVESFYNFTRGRFLCNERQKVKEHYVHYNIDKLAEIGAKAVGSSFCREVKKFPDGLYNKALHLTMDDGKEAVAKIPNPNAGQPYFTTASEVATMSFVSKLNDCLNSMLIRRRCAISWERQRPRYMIGAPAPRRMLLVQSI